MPRWLSFHLFYHGDRNIVLFRFLLPLVICLLDKGLMQGMFFVRYALGGPHLRIRFRVKPGAEQALEEEVGCRAQRFFARWPSTTPLSEQAIRECNQIVLRDDLGGLDVVHPDNSIEQVVYEAEVERYGGEDHLRCSHEFFIISSVQALHFVASQRECSWGHQLTQAFCVLLRQAWGLARCKAEFLDLLDYVAGWTIVEEAIQARGDALFQTKGIGLCSLFESELKALIGRGGDSMLARREVAAAERLSRELHSVDQATWRRVATSQMHMTSNRLGLKNLEEVYICRLLTRVAAEMAERRSTTWRDACAALAEPATREAGGLSDLVGPALNSLRIWA